MDKPGTTTAAALELKHLRCLVAIVDTGSFTDAGHALGISQAAVSRTLAGLETLLGVRLLHRTSRSVAPTTAGVQALARARILLAAAEELVREATTGHTRLHIGHAMASDDPWARRRNIRLDEIPRRTLAIDRRTGTTALGLWPEADRPAVEFTHDIDDWLAAIATGRCIGLTPQATAAQYRRDGITYRPLRGAEPVPVHLIWRAHTTHPATHTAIALAAGLYREARRAPRSRG
ncbi:LysR family transcriptional regulator [Streptomyces sp. MBT56]|uniref:LysR family transcriptional regulator n=1 Tax=Streptomyces sp. MBT56 TaxID=1488387 RepID=UPI00190A57F5|nr:LysR family transcriptional regulator [Streptomyces sp. MBT56]MBK3555630.1 LysR family transcriptional regulator [Streptomyces sp. MBT56]